MDFDVGARGPHSDPAHYLPHAWLHLTFPNLTQIFIMKKIMPLPSLAGCAVLLIALLTSGCKEKGTDSDAIAPTNASSARVATADPDNTAKNVRDRDGATLTAGDQGNSPADREITQKIRKSLVIDATGYSTTAKNIKIITMDGKVTLRGPVTTMAEKTGIAAIAATVAGPGNVDNQLEVKNSNP